MKPPSSLNPAFGPPSLVLLALLGFGLCSACTFDYGEAKFTIGAVSAHNACFSQAFPLEATFFSARERANSVGVFLQSVPGHIGETDLVFFEVYQPDFVNTRLGQPIALSPPEQSDAVVRGKLALMGACPQMLESFYIAGDVVFEALDPLDTQSVAGTIEGASIVDARTGVVVAEGLSGSWRFDVRRSQPFQEFFAQP
ncbi:MAG: hypothetical protein H0U74_14505 [Bradymonadaceae bacterium]|nr:hypothetical protein [Lujinxingiaceae bacterium]